MSIPSIAFNHQQSHHAELQILDLTELRQRTTLLHNPEHPHRVQFFGILYIEQGTGLHMVDFKQYAFQAGSVIFVQREQVHSFDFSNKPKGKVLLFTQAFLDQVHANMRLPNYTPTHLNIQHSPLLQLDANDQQKSLTLIQQMIDEIGSSHSDPLIVMYFFCAFALSLHRLRPELKQDKLSQAMSVRFARFFELMQTHFHKTRDANWYALQLNTTYKTLNHVCKLATGLTAKQLIDAFSILEIKRRLVVSNVTSSQIAYDFGFEDASNFVKYFKKLTGTTPSKFSQQYKKPSL
ncbi:transcriptional regulator AraC family [Photobacterium aphoticum]|uniref:Transcriptional regulator AraC family n=1 Tax=Photobacterium aphoticum TaxID=754436 RepID=A0A090R3G9_9GAMM|nr:transcriptional regulator AraC family [Photobacterium aphoticum]